MSASLPITGYEQRVRRVYDHLYANANVRTPHAIGREVFKIIRALKFAQLPPVDALPTLSKRDIQAIERGDSQLIGTVVAEVEARFEAMNAAERLYDAKERVELAPRHVAYVYAQLWDISFGADRDWLGDAVEIFRSVFSKRLGGQFFTDQRVTELAMDLLEFDPDQDDLVDVCSGTGGFLLAAARRWDAGRHEGASLPIHGLEIDPEVADIANGSLATRKRLRAIYVHQADSLAPPEAWPSHVQERVGWARHGCLASNPPFGTKTTVKDERVLTQYDLARAWSRDSGGTWSVRSDVLRPRPPDVLFLERNLQLARPGSGRVAIVTPYQALSGPQLGFVREWVLQHARVRAVIDLPADTFQPHTGTKTSLLVFERRDAPMVRWEEDDEHPIFMAVAEHIGHDRRGNPIHGSDGEVLTDLPLIGRAYEAFCRGDDPDSIYSNCFAISSRDIRREDDLRINAFFHRPTLKSMRSALSNLNGGNWDVTTIGAVTEQIFYPGRFKRNYTQDGGVPFLGGTNITQLFPTNEKFISPEDPRLGELAVRAGWLLVTRSGSTGIISSVPQAWDGVAVSEHVIRIVPNEEKLPAGYLQAYLRTDQAQALLRAGVFGSVIDEITPEHIAAMPIPVPRDRKILRNITRDIEDAEAARTSAITSVERAVAAVQHAIEAHL